MSAITEPSQELLSKTRQQAHRHCVVCSPQVPHGLGVQFETTEDGGVEGTFFCQDRFSGYSGLLHGGVISALLDGAMTNCLFAHGTVAVTAELTVRFRHPITLDAPVTVSAKIVRSCHPLHVLEGRIVQAGQLKAKGTGKFMTSPDTSTPDI